MEACERLDSCVYLQYDASTCYLCIKNAADVTNDGSLTSTTAQQVETHVKLGIENVIFTSQSCEGPLAYAFPGNFNGKTNQGQRVTGMEFCGDTFGNFDDKISGFKLKFDGTTQQIQVGCYNPIWDQFPDFEIADNEVVLQVDTCFGSVSGYNILNTITIHTNLRQFGPHGTAAAGGCVTYSNSGYELIGFYGRAGAAVDDIGSYFSRC